MKGCPNCGADRLRSASIPIIDQFRRLTSSRRRYRCSVCGWRGFRHRLVRPRSGEPRGWQRTVSILALVLLVTTALIGAGLAYESCQARSHDQSTPAEGPQ